MNTIATQAAVTPVHPKPPEAGEADRERSNRGERASSYRAVGAGTLRSPYRLPDRDGQVSQLQLWQHSGDCQQKPDATRVAGLYAWNQLGRKVKKGEHGIRILAPMIGVRRKKDEEAEKDIRTQNQAVLVRFRAAYVFDVSQTEGNPLPEFSERVSGNAGGYRDQLVDFVIGQGIELEFRESIAPALGMSYGGKIALLPGQSSAEEFSTLVHELAHLCCVRSYVA